MNKKNMLQKLLPYLKPHRKWIILGFISALISVPMTLLGPVFIGNAIDAVVGAGDVDFQTVYKNLFYLVASSVIASLFQWIMQIANREASALVAQEMRRNAFCRINEAPLQRIDTEPHGDLVSRMVNDSDAVAEGILQGMTQLFPGIITLLGTLALMFYLHLPLALIVFAITPLSVLFAQVIVRRSGKYFIRQSVAQGQMSSSITETVNNQDLVRVFGYEQQAQEVFEETNKEYFETNYKATLYSSIINPGTRLVNNIVYIAVGFAGALSAINGDITVGIVSAFLSYANQYTKPFNEVTAVMTQLQSAVAGAKRLLEVIEWAPENADAVEAIAPAHAQGDVRAENVCFSYNPERPLIRNFTMEARPGQRFALVGPTGCGKTTIINLLMRFYELDSGKIMVDGQPIMGIKRNALRGMYGMVLQETWLKKATVAENIAYGRPSAGRDDIISAAKAAYAHSFIKQMPNGYDTIIESGGGNLSAGQKQLLCIARIMLARPDMLILDEATSSIDTRTEILIQKALDRLMQGHTSFIVAHRLSTIRNADCILVMKDGCIIEQGTHERLLEEDGFYSNLYRSGSFSEQAP